MKRKDYQCLMIETKDNRKLFTYEKNLPQLTEFAKSIDAEISVVKVEEANVLSLDNLPTAICNCHYEAIKPVFETIEVKFINKKKSRQKILLDSERIRGFIKQALLTGKPLSLGTITKRFSKHNMTKACFCNHLRRAREELLVDGHKVEKIKHGEYQLTKN